MTYINPHKTSVWNKENLQKYKAIISVDNFQQTLEKASGNTAKLPEYLLFGGMEIDFPTTLSETTEVVFLNCGNQSPLAEACLALPLLG